MCMCVWVDNIEKSDGRRKVNKGGRFTVALTKPHIHYPTVNLPLSKNGCRERG